MDGRPIFRCELLVSGRVTLPKMNSLFRQSHGPVGRSDDFPFRRSVIFCSVPWIGCWGNERIKVQVGLSAVVEGGCNMESYC